MDRLVLAELGFFCERPVFSRDPEEFLLEEMTFFWKKLRNLSLLDIRKRLEGNSSGKLEDTGRILKKTKVAK